MSRARVALVDSTVNSSTVESSAAVTVRPANTSALEAPSRPSSVRTDSATWSLRTRSRSVPMSTGVGATFSEMGGSDRTRTRDVAL